MKVNGCRKSAVFLLFLFTIYWCGITFFTHSHIENGSTIVHSHPFKAKHHHTEQQYETIFFVTCWCAPEISLPPIIGTTYFTLLAIFSCPLLALIAVSDYTRNIFLRGPPALRG